MVVVLRNYLSIRKVKLNKKDNNKIKRIIYNNPNLLISYSINNRNSKSFNKKIIDKNKEPILIHNITSSRPIILINPTLYFLRKKLVIIIYFRIIMRPVFLIVTSKNNNSPKGKL